MNKKGKNTVNSPFLKILWNDYGKINDFCRFNNLHFKVNIDISRLYFFKVLLLSVK